MTHKFTTKLLMSLTVILALFTSQPTQSRPQNFTGYENAVLNNTAWSDSDAMEDDGETRKCCKVCASEVLAGRVFTRDLTVSGTGTIENLVVTNATDFPPAPALITVNPANPENRFATVPNFQTIQGAIDWLQNKKIVNTLISVVDGTYPEALNIQSILSSDSSKLVLQGDIRDFVGLGINHGSSWNVGGTGFVGGIAQNGEAVLAGLAGSPTLSVTGTLGAVSPDFTAGGNPAQAVTAGDRVLIRHNDGTFALYTIASVTPTVLTLTSNLAVNVNALGAAMSIVPRVEIAPPLGSSAAILQGTQIKLSGLFINSPAGVFGIRVYPYSNTAFDNVLMFGSSGLIGNPATAASNFAHPALTTLGGRNFGSTFFYDNTGTAITIQNYGTFVPANSLVAGRPGARILISAMSLIAGGNVRYINNITVSSRSYLATIFGNQDIITHSGTALYLEYGSLATGNTGRWRILGTPTAGPAFGIDAHDSRLVLKLAPISFDSVNAAFIPIRLGSQAVSGENTDASLNLGSVTMTSAGPIAQVLNGSRLALTTVAGPFSLGAATNGFVVSDASSLVWNAGSFSPAAPTTGTLFDIRGDSELVIPTGAARTFSNFNTIFNFDNNASGDIFNATATANAGGINVQARNMSRVLLDTVTLSGANTGIATASGGYVGQVGAGTPVTNSSTTPYSPVIAHRTTAAALTTYVQSYDDGTIVINP